MLRLKIEEDGSLYQCNQEYVCWYVDDPRIALDGEFTSAELRTLADHMDKHQKVKTDTEDTEDTVIEYIPCLTEAFDRFLDEVAEAYGSRTHQRGS